MARAGGYYGTEFQGERRVMQGDLLSPTIFNMVVDAVVHNWVLVVVLGGEERDECGKEVMHQAALFYSDDGIVVSSGPPLAPGCIQHPGRPV